MMKKMIPQAVAMVLLVTALHAQEAKAPARSAGAASQPAAQAEITAALKSFLAKVDDAATHEQWWADELVYTGSNGTVRGKAEIVRSVREAQGKPADGKQPASTFDAEDIKVTQYGELAVLTFRLVQREGETVNHFRNTGTLVKRGGRWQVVAWQATKAK